MSVVNKLSTFRVPGMKISSKEVRNVTSSHSPIEEVGTNQMLADGTMVSLVRTHLRKKRSVSVSGNSIVPPAFLSDMFIGHIFTFDDPNQYSINSYYNKDEIPFGIGKDFPPVEDRIWYFGYVNNNLVVLPDGHPNIEKTLYSPRITIMIDSFSCERDDATSDYNWSFEGRTV